MKRGVFIILGYAGAGKGTIAKKLSADFHLHPISSGDLLRQHIKDGTPIGKNAQNYMSEGKLVPSSIVFDLLRHEIEFNPKIKPLTPILLDGFPRSIEQAITLQAMAPVIGVISLDIPQQVVIERIGNRWIHAASGRTYSQDDYNRPNKWGFDDVTGDVLIQREDDKPAAIKKRLDLYDTMKDPLLGYYDSIPPVEVGHFKGSETTVIYPFIKEFIIQKFKL